MPKLTRSRLAEITKVLDDSLFTSAGYDTVTFDNDTQLVRVSFNDNKDYFIFLVYEEKKLKSDVLMPFHLRQKEWGMRVHVHPGDFTEKEAFWVDDFEGFLNALGEWTQRIKSEILLLNVFQKQFDDFQAELKRKLDDHVADDKAHFSEQEREALYARLRQFEERFAKFESEDESRVAEFAEIRSVIADLAQAAHTLSRRTWFKTATSKLFVLSTRALTSKPGQELLTGVINKLLDLPHGDGSGTDTHPTS